MFEASVIVCSHNSRQDYLRRTLAALQLQTHSNDGWELLLVDNASQSPLALNWDLSWHPHARHIREDELGLSMARQRGMREALADLLVFVDDDNVLHPDYLAEAIKIKNEWPQLGAWGGSIVAEFETQPPAYLSEFMSVLALREVHTARWSNVPTCGDAEPWGAGLCLRAQVAAAYIESYKSSAIKVGDRVGTALLSGGDTEIAHVACSLGLGMGVFPVLRVLHLIPRERIEEGYLLRLTQGIQTSALVLDYKWRSVPPKSPISVPGIARLVLQLMFTRGIHRRIHWVRFWAKVNACRIVATGSDLK